MSGYFEKNGNLRGQGGVELYWHSWCSSNPRGVLVLVHGLGEHCGRYGNLIEHMEGDDISFYALDHRGHGRSQGAPGHLEAFDDYISDLHRVVKVAMQQNPKLPIIMLGHSLGGLIAGRYALEYPQDLQALILSSAALIQKKPVPTWMQKVYGIIANIAPRLTVSNGLQVEDLSHDESVVKAYIDDPLVHNRITVKWGMEFIDSQRLLLDRAPQLRMPLLVSHGANDNIVDCMGSKELYKAAQSRDKELHIFEGLYHETMNERFPERNQVLETVAAWIRRHM